MVRATLVASLALVACLVLSCFRTDRAQAQWIDPCAGLTSYAAALAVFVSLGGPVADPGAMDGDGDGFSCEYLPGAPSVAATAPTGVYPRGGNAGGGPPVPEASPVLSVGGVADPPIASATPAVPDSGGEGSTGNGPDLDTLPGVIAPDAISVHVRIIEDDADAGLFVYGIDAPETGRPATGGERTIATVDVMTGIVIDVGTTDGAGRLIMDAEYDVPFTVVAFGDSGGSQQYIIGSGMSLTLHVSSFVASEGPPVGGVNEPPVAPVEPGPTDDRVDYSGDAPVTGPVEGDVVVGDAANPANDPVRAGGDLPVAGVSEGPSGRVAAVGLAIGAIKGTVLALPAVGAGTADGGSNLSPVVILVSLVALACGGGAMATRNDRPALSLRCCRWRRLARVADQGAGGDAVPPMVAGGGEISRGATMAGARCAPAIVNCHRSDR